MRSIRESLEIVKEASRDYRIKWAHAAWKVYEPGSEYTHDFTPEVYMGITLGLIPDWKKEYEIEDAAWDDVSMEGLKRDVLKNVSSRLRSLKFKYSPGSMFFSANPKISLGDDTPAMVVDVYVKVNGKKPNRDREEELLSEVASANGLNVKGLAKKNS